MNKLFLAVLVALSTTMAGCMSEPTVSGQWDVITHNTDGTIAHDGICDASGVQDLVKLTASGSNNYVYEATLSCSDAGFAIAVPDGTSDLKISLHVIVDGPPRADFGALHVAGPIDSDVDLGNITWSR